MQDEAITTSWRALFKQNPLSSRSHKSLGANKGISSLCLIFAVQTHPRVYLCGSYREYWQIEDKHTIPCQAYAKASDDHIAHARDPIVPTDLPQLAASITVNHCCTRGRRNIYLFVQHLALIASFVGYVQAKDKCSFFFGLQPKNLEDKTCPFLGPIQYL
jgi:hypothetical protein